jgi:hypothetical protein
VQSENLWQLTAAARVRAAFLAPIPVADSHLLGSIFRYDESLQLLYRNKVRVQRWLSTRQAAFAAECDLRAMGRAWVAAKLRGAAAEMLAAEDTQPGWQP